MRMSGVTDISSSTGWYGLLDSPVLLWGGPIHPVRCQASQRWGRHLLIHEYSGRESEPPLGSPASHRPLWPPPCPPEPRLLTYPAAAGPNCSHVCSARQGIFQAPDMLWGVGKLPQGSGICVMWGFSPLKLKPAVQWLERGYWKPLGRGP